MDENHNRNTNQFTMGWVVTGLVVISVFLLLFINIQLNSYPTYFQFISRIITINPHQIQHHKTNHREKKPSDYTNKSQFMTGNRTSYVAFPYENDKKNVFNKVRKPKAYIL